ncbi:tyrosine-protein kinase SRK2-like [Pezoporus flaviventris]|uniref:tyrosine-protein kinase SRK2-like n=1 Tax=Pezoporus flaviventris TaxID=889875 RepID=UPI002AB0B63C|nr:tyrosine-protein kinase SRK2-like [Pezoporus flaviventris]
MELSFFHGKITRRTCEELMSKKGKNGSYLVRESESMEGVLCLCVLFEKCIYTYRIFRAQQGYFKIQTSEGVPEKVFRTLKDLIYNYEKPNQGLVINLRYPVKKLEASRRSQRFNSGKDVVYDGEKFSSAFFVVVLGAGLLQEGRPFYTPVRMKTLVYSPGTVHTSIPTTVQKLPPLPLGGAPRLPPRPEARWQTPRPPVMPRGPGGLAHSVGGAIKMAAAAGNTSCVGRLRR